MRYTIAKGAALAVAAVLATTSGALAASETKQKIEQKAEEGKDKVRSTAQSAKGQVNDSWITAKTKIALYADDRVKGSQVNVTTNRGVVVLQGKVDSTEAKSSAAEIARGIDGVKEVKNDLQVVPRSEQKAVKASDKELTKSVKERLKRDPQLKNAKIDAQVDAGVVTLTGDAPSITASARASELAREVPGVRSVKNELATGSRG